MTKKHFIRAAEIVQSIRSGHWSEELPGFSQHEVEMLGCSTHVTDFERATLTAEAFIILGRAFNLRFDTQRFLVACGLIDDKPAKHCQSRTS